MPDSSDSLSRPSWEGKLLCDRYLLIRRVGKGGQGFVFYAHDTRMKNREVAIKLLSGGIFADDKDRRRLLQEAESLSRLNHPNIATIYNVENDEGQDFLVMEWIPGSSLDQQIGSGPLEDGQVLYVGEQIADALAYAHEQGVVHRDLKPANVMVMPLRGRERVRVLDFGLARLRGSSDGASSSRITSSRNAVGTLPYIAPEHIKDDCSDPCVDVYALGAVLYEMSTGRRAFPQENESAILYAILNVEPERPRTLRSSISPRLEEVIVKAMAKDPSRRHASADDLLEDLKKVEGTRQQVIDAKPVKPPYALAGVIGALALGVGVILGAVFYAYFRPSVPPPAGTRLMVMPFETMDPDPGQRYFGEGIAEELRDELGRLSSPKLDVIGRATTLKNRDLDLRAVERQLRVDYVLDGTVRRAGSRVRIAAELVRAKDKIRLWSQTYDRELGDILSVQNEVARAVTGQVQVKLDPGEQARLAAARAVTPRAYEAYLMGRVLASRRPEGLEASLDGFEEAIALSPDYAPAWSGLADTYLSLAEYRLRPAREALQRARQAARRALALDPKSAPAWTSQAGIKMQEWDWKGAERDFRQALKLDPMYTIAQHRRADFLMRTGRVSLAVAEVRRARDLDPSSILLNDELATAYLFDRRYPQAIEQSQVTLALDSTHAESYSTLGLAWWKLGEYPQAMAAWVQVLTLAGMDGSQIESFRAAFRDSGPAAIWSWQLERLQPSAEENPESQPAYDIAQLQAMLGRRDAAFAWLERGFRRREQELPLVAVDPHFDGLRDDPRYRSLIRRMRLPRD